jgi:hypothetical protein
LILQLQINGTRDIISPWGWFNNTFPFTIFLPLPLPFPRAVLCSLPISGPFLTALRAILTLAVVIVMAIAGTAPSTKRRSGIRPVVIIITLVDCLIPILLFNGQEVTWFVLPAAWRLDLCPEIISTIRRETVAGAHTHSRAGCLWIGDIDLIPKCTGVVSSPIVHGIAGFVKYLPHI